MANCRAVVFNCGLFSVSSAILNLLESSTSDFIFMWNGSYELNLKLCESFVHKKHTLRAIFYKRAHDENE